jgi:hypothetical protein
MKELLKILGIPVPDTAQVTDLNLAFRGLSPSTALLIALVLVAATAWAYWRTTARLGQGQKITLIVLRSLLLVMIVVLLMRPVLLLTLEGTIRRSLILLIDASASMQIKDLRQDPADLQRGAIATGPSGGPLRVQRSGAVRHPQKNAHAGPARAAG